MSDLPNVQPDEIEFEGFTLRVHRQPEVNDSKIPGMSYFTVVVFIQPAPTGGNVGAVAGIGSSQEEAVADGVKTAKSFIRSQS